MAIIARRTSETPDIAPLYTTSLEHVKLIVGLGNHGDQYAKHRHNVGFMCLDHFAQIYEADWQVKKDFKAQLAQVDLGGVRLLLLKPQTYMNNSGEAVQLVQKFYKLNDASLLVIYDEIRLKFGVIEAMVTEQTFGHNGLKSLQSTLQQNLQLIRVGIGPKTPPEIDLSTFVLSAFSDAENFKLNKITKEVCSLLGEASSQNLMPHRRTVD